MVYAAKKSNIPVILSVVSMPQKIDTISKIIYRNVKGYCDHIIVNASTIKDFFVRNYNFPENKLIILHNCVDTREIINCKGSFKKYLDENFNVKDNKLIGYVGRIEYLKGVFILIEAFAKVLESFKNVKLVLVGSGEIEKAKVYANHLKIEENIIFTGYYDGNIYDVLDVFDIFAFPSFWEGLPYSILEAMAMGKIIIASDVGGIPELIVDGSTGILVKPKCSIDLADNLINILNNMDNYISMRNNAKETIEEKFSSIQFAINTNQIINETAK